MNKLFLIFHELNDDKLNLELKITTGIINYILLIKYNLCVQTFQHVQALIHKKKTYLDFCYNFSLFN